jgi:hypothetical protein
MRERRARRERDHTEERRNGDATHTLVELNALKPMDGVKRLINSNVK